MRLLKVLLLIITLSLVASAQIPTVYTRILPKHYPLRLKMAWNGGSDWDMARFDLVISTIFDTSVIKQAKTIKDSTYYIVTNDWYCGGTFRQDGIPAHPYNEFLIRTPSGSILRYGGSDGFCDVTEYCVPHGGKKYNVFMADSVYTLYNWGIWDGAFSDNCNHTYYDAVSLPRDGSTTPPTEKERAVHTGLNIAWERLRTNWGSKGGFWGYFTAASSTLLGSGNVDTLGLHWANGVTWENAMGPYNHISGSDRFGDWKNISDAWTRLHVQNPMMLCISTSIDRDRGNAPGYPATNRYKENWQFARYWIGWGTLTDTYIAIQNSDNGSGALFTGAEHDNDLWFDEFDLRLGQPKGPAVRSSGFWVRFFDNGCVLFSGDTTSPVTVTSSQLTGLAGYTGPYYRYLGGQDTTVNNGQAFTSVIFTPHAPSHSAGYTRVIGDALFLLNYRDTVVSDIIVDNSDYSTSPGSQPAALVGFSWDNLASNGNSSDSKAPLFVNPCYSTAIRASFESGAPYIQRQHYTNAGDGSSVATFTPQINVAGWYNVYEWHGWRGMTESQYQEATNAPLRINYSGGYKDIAVNQRINAGKWNLLGTFFYQPKQPSSAVLKNGPNCDGPVIADAMRWERARAEIIRPTINLNSTSLPSFGNVVTGDCSHSNSYMISGSNLADNISITAPVGFQISRDTVNFSSQLTLSQSGGIVQNTTIFVKFCPVSAIFYSGNIVHASNGAFAQYVAVIGTGQIDSSGTGGSPPAAPTPLSPPFGAANIQTSTVLRWDTVASAVSYHLQVAADSAIHAIVYEDTAIQSNSRQIGSLTSSRTYYWRVSAKNRVGNGPFSDVYIFMTEKSNQTLVIDRKIINFGKVAIGAVKTDSIFLSNSGSSALTITDIRPASSVFPVNPRTANLNPGDSVKVYIGFTPTQRGSYASSAAVLDTIQAINDTVWIAGQGTLPPHLRRTPSAISFSNIPLGSSRTDSFAVYNEGELDLEIHDIVSTNPSITVAPKTANVPPGDSQWFRVTATPSSNRPDSGMIVLMNNSDVPEDSAKVKISILTGVGDNRQTPQAFVLYNNYPNPFNPTTYISYALPVDSRVLLKIFDVIGREVKLLFDEVQPAGEKTCLWDATDNHGRGVSSGLYYFRLQAAGLDKREPFMQVKKMSLIR
jgi:hypothetical protein